MNIYCHEFLRSLKAIGFFKTIQHVWFFILEILFDLKYGTKTMGWERISELDINSSSVASGVDYHPTRSRSFKKLMKELKLPKEAVFLDFGCGKGKCLLLSMGHGFNRIVGVEFSSLLCDIATRNVNIFKQKTKSASQVKIVLKDAADYEIKDEDSIFYFFNPFDDKVFGKILLNIKTSLENCKRKIWIIYLNPIYGEIFDRNRDFLPLKSEYAFGGHKIFVFENII